MVYDGSVTRLSGRAFAYVLGAFCCVAGAYGQKTGASNPEALPECGPLTGQVFRCPKLGFTYTVPFGWVDRTKALQAAGGASTQQNSAADQARETPSGNTLLGLFERPPEAQSANINSAVIIAVEGRSSYPRLKTAADYFAPLSEIAEQRGLKMQGDPYSFDLHGKEMARGDFQSTGPNSVWQSSLVILEKRYILSFTFLSDSEEGVDSLMDNLTFTSTGRKTIPK